MVIPGCTNSTSTESAMAMMGGHVAVLAGEKQQLPPKCLGPSPHFVLLTPPDRRHVERLHYLSQAQGQILVDPRVDSLTDDSQVRCDFATHNPCTNCQKSDVECK